MCNIYRISPSSKRGKDQGVRGKIAAVAPKLRSAQVRISDPGIVVLAGERVEIMRWGFHRPFNPAINNARSDKLEAGMWANAYRERRCVIPVNTMQGLERGVAAYQQVVFRTICEQAFKKSVLPLAVMPGSYSVSFEIPWKDITGDLRPVLERVMAESVTLTAENSDGSIVNVPLGMTGGSRVAFSCEALENAVALRFEVGPVRASAYTVEHQLQDASASCKPGGLACGRIEPC